MADAENDKDVADANKCTFGLRQRSASDEEAMGTFIEFAFSQSTDILDDVNWQALADAFVESLSDKTRVANSQTI